MHATIPAMPKGIHLILQSGIQSAKIDSNLNDLLDLAGGKMLAEGMAILVKLGFGFLISEGLGGNKAEKAISFFEDNFVIKDPNAENGIRYYQGNFLIRTKKPDDQMNVWIRFCPDPSALFMGQRLNPAAIVATEALSEAQAEEIEHDPQRCDLVIRFKDTQAILGLVQRPDPEVVQLLLENLVQITGNFGHMFKFGSIGKSAQNFLEN